MTAKVYFFPLSPSLPFVSRTVVDGLFLADLVVTNLPDTALR
jgi:hypothetical protein